MFPLKAEMKEIKDITSEKKNNKNTQRYLPCNRESTS